MVGIPLRRGSQRLSKQPFPESFPRGSAWRACPPVRLDTPHGVRTSYPGLSSLFCPLLSTLLQAEETTNTPHLITALFSLKTCASPYQPSFRLHRGHSRPFLCRLANICRPPQLPALANRHLSVLRGVSKPSRLGSQEEKNPSS